MPPLNLKSCFAEMQNGGPEALYLNLKKRRIKSDLRYPPHTEGLVEQKMLGMDIVYQWLYARIAEDETLIDRSKNWQDGIGEFKSELKNTTSYTIRKLQSKWITDWVPYEVIYDDFNNFEKKAGKGRYGTSRKAFSQKLKEILEIGGAKQRTIQTSDPSSLSMAIQDIGAPRGCKMPADESSAREIVGSSR